MFRQQALLAAISEKDANIALLELSSSNKKKTQEEVMSLKREKDRLMQQLKQQVSLKHTNPALKLSCLKHFLNTLTQTTETQKLFGNTLASDTCSALHFCTLTISSENSLDYFQKIDGYWNSTQNHLNVRNYQIMILNMYFHNIFL